MRSAEVLKAIDGRGAAKILKEECGFKMTKSSEDGFFVLSAHVNLKDANPEIAKLVQSAFGNGPFARYSKNLSGEPLDRFDIESKYSVSLDDKEAKQMAANGFGSLLCKKLNETIKEVSMNAEVERRGMHGLPTSQTKPEKSVLKMILNRLAHPIRDDAALNH